MSTGDLSSGVWCFAIGLHTFASVVFDYRLSKRSFFTSIFGLWVFIYGISLVGVGMYGKSLYVRSGVWVCNFFLRHPPRLTQRSAGYTTTSKTFAYGSTTSGSLSSNSAMFSSTPSSTPSLSSASAWAITQTNKPGVSKRYHS